MREKPDFLLDAFIRDRNEALLSLDEIKIRAFAAKYGSPTSNDPEVFWRSVHKAITACTDLPIEFRRKSKQWLDKRHSSSFDDGEL